MFQKLEKVGVILFTSTTLNLRGVGIILKYHLKMTEADAAEGTGARAPSTRQGLQAWVYPYYFLTCQSPFSRRFHHEGVHLGTDAWESI